MPSNSSSRLKTIPGFHSVMARRKSDRLSLRPKGMTSCPAFFRCEITSYSVRHSSISFSVDPLSDSGGTRVEWTSTKARTFFTAAISYRYPRQLAFFVGFREARDHPQQLGPESSPGAAHVQIQGFAACNHQ